MLSSLGTFLLVLTFLVSFIFLIVLLIYFHPRPFIRVLATFVPDVFWFKSTTKKVIALSIDDVPTDQTPVILSILAQYNAKATFFVIGSYSNKEKRDTLKQILLDGHELGNHTCFDRPSVSLDNETLEREIVSVSNLLKSVELEVDVNHNNNHQMWFRPGIV
eukprot:TRINITY_DN7093_c0_g1_i1.p1 TRINITY_DN7093_c0_g1~~TRINITY_DN7093_c0_g1_i1.p1  ORF type:complete len:182 (-),score=25.79 TRINITY_DN7093_c0_g1_i1:491-976(-)